MSRDNLPPKADQPRAEKIKVYNQNGEVVGEEKLEPAIFGIEVKPELIHQAIVTQMANSRQVLAHTKGRSEVRGGGKKPWRQKGTGRARHGSIRSPLWKGGGVTFGPTKERNFSKKMNKKAKRKALFMALSNKLANERLLILDKLNLAEIKTKKLFEILKKLPSKDKKTLIVLDKKDETLIKSAYNIPFIKTILANNLNILDVIGYEYTLFLKKSLKVIKETYLKQESKKT